jgi:seryl-tRNA synthetase
MGDVGDDLEQVEERALSYAVEVDSLRKAIKSLQTQFASAAAERDELASELVAMTNHCGRQREELQELQENLALMTQDRDQLAEAVKTIGQQNTAEQATGGGAVSAYPQGFSDGKTWAFREVQHWLRPFVGAGAEDAAALLDAVPGLVKRLAECEGVTI